MTSESNTSFPLFDTHCHLDFPQFSEDFAGQLQKATAKGVQRFLIPSIGEQNWHQIDALSAQYPSIYYSAGFHPYFLTQEQPAVDTRLEDFLATRRAGKCVAIGETGLDFAIQVDKQVQQHYLQLQLQLAQQLKMPVILHSRKSHNELTRTLKQHKFQQGGVLHGFSGSYEQAMQFVDLGFHIGVGGTITYPRAQKTRSAIARLPLSSLVLETDAPDMPLNGYQGQPNHPKQLVNVLETLCLLKEESMQTIACAAWKNSNLLFGICE
ncbi:TatD family hydrolase [Vibrio paucivorans]